MPYCLIKNDTICNVVVCDAAFAVENGLTWVDQEVSFGFVLVDGVWRDKPFDAKALEVRLHAMERSRFLQFDYIDNATVWGALSADQQAEILVIKEFCDTVEAQAGFPYDLSFPDRKLVNGEV